LVPAHRRDALARGIDWDGFNASERGDVIMRVLDGEPSHLWTRGVKEYNPWEDFAWPLTEKQHAAYLGDIAASYGMTAEEVDDYYERMATEDDAQIEDGAGPPAPLREVDLESVAKDARARFLGDTGPGFGAQEDREALLRETHQLARDLGDVGFRDEYFNDPDAIAEWPDPAVRERELKAFWDSKAEESFAGFRASHAHEGTEIIMADRDYLRGLSQADENSQRAFYSEVSALGRAETIDKDGRGIAERVTEISGGGDEIPTGEEWRKLQAELTHDHGARRMEDRGVNYEDAVERMQDHADASKPVNILERARLLGEEGVGRVVDPDRHPDRER
jgi:hypothetical protein